MNYLSSIYTGIQIGVLVVCTTLNLWAQEYDRTQYEQYPSYEALCLHYALQDSIYGMAMDKAVTFRFEKNEKGWYVRKLKNNGQGWQTLFYKQIWSATKQDYLKAVDSTNFRPNILQTVAKNITAADAIFYDQCPTFGYVGAVNKNIELLEQVETHTTNECACLSHAYNSKMYEVLFRDADDLSRFHRYDYSLDLRQFSQETWQQYLDILEKLKAVYNEWNTLDEDAWVEGMQLPTLIAHRLMNVYLQMQMLDKTDEAKPILEQVNYSDWTLTSAKNVLKTCEKDAVVILGSEHSFYPMLYLQEQEKYRQDVSLVYVPYLNLGRYIHFLTERQSGKKRIMTSLHIDHYKVDRGLYWIAKNEEEIGQQPVRLKQFFTNYPAYNSEQPATYTLPALVWQTGIRDTASLMPNTEMLYQGAALLKREDIALLDILATNTGKRNIYLGMDVVQINQWNLRDYLVLEGLLCTWTLEKQVVNDGVFAGDADALMQHFKKEYKITTFPNAALNQSAEHRLYSNWYATGLVYLAGHYTLESPDAFLTYVEWMHKTFPIESFDYASAHLIMAYTLHEMGETTLAQEHIAAFAHGVEQKSKRMNDIRGRIMIRNEVLLLLNLCKQMGWADAFEQYKAQFWMYLTTE